MQKQSQVIKNYLLLANNFKDANSLTKFIDENLHETSMKDIVIVNKPPGFVLSNKSKDSYNLIEVLKQNIQRKLNWPNALRIPIVTDDQCGIFMFTSNQDTFREARKTMITMFPSSHVPFLKFYGITTHVPIESQGKQVLNLNRQKINEDLFVWEDKNVSNNNLKSNKTITYQIEHRVLDVNPNLDVALVEFETSWHNGDGIPFYSTKNLSPLLGDQKYSNFIKYIMGKPVLSVVDPKSFKKQPKELHPKLLESLDVNKFILERIPLHLQLYEINLEKRFKKQKVFFKTQVPIQSFFLETLKRLCLSIPK